MSESVNNNLEGEQSYFSELLNKVQIPVKVAFDKINWYFSKNDKISKYKENIDDIMKHQPELQDGLNTNDDIDHDEIMRSVIYENMIKSNNKRLYQESIIEKAKSLGTEPTKVTDRIYVGNSFNACNYYQLKKLGIKMIVNATYDIRNYYPEDFIYVRIPIEDDNTESICKYLKFAYNKIDNFINSNEIGNILVHCMMGASRSVTIISYYIAVKQNKNIKTIIEDLKKIRPIVNPTRKLVNDLVNELNGKQE